MERDIVLAAATITRAFEDCPIAFIFGDRNRNIILANRAAAQLLGYTSASELIGKPVYSMIDSLTISEEKHDGFYDHYMDNGPLQSQIGEERPLVGKKCNGETIPIAISLYKVSDEKGDYIVDVMRDRTKELNTLAQLQEYTNTIEQQKAELEELNEQNQQTIQDLAKAKSDLSLKLKRSALQRLIIVLLFSTVVGFYIIANIMALFPQAAKAVAALNRDATMLIINGLIGSISYIMGRQSNKPDKNEETE
jgi:PAS domain S-box-containing protein